MFTTRHFVLGCKVLMSLLHYLVGKQFLVSITDSMLQMYYYEDIQCEIYTHLGLHTGIDEGPVLLLLFCCYHLSYSRTSLIVV
jgi:hypothetical protein